MRILIMCFVVSGCASTGNLYWEHPVNNNAQSKYDQRQCVSASENKDGSIDKILYDKCAQDKGYVKVYR